MFYYVINLDIVSKNSGFYKKHVYFIKTYVFRKSMCVLEKHVALAIKGKRIEIHVS